jgi:nicotinamidase/pyrazinamidase
MISTHALLVIDIQNDSFSEGQFSIPESESILPLVNRYIQNFESSNLPIIASRDWHPRISYHFYQYGGKWPIHCIANTWGAQFHPKLILPETTIVISKGMKTNEDPCSAFQGFDESGRSLSAILNSQGITTLSICGIATDYCIKYSTLHAIESGLKVLLLIDAIMGLNLVPSDSIRSIDEMIISGAEPITIDSFRLF